MWVVGTTTLSAETVLTVKNGDVIRSPPPPLAAILFPAATAAAAAPDPDTVVTILDMVVDILTRDGCNDIVVVPIDENNRSSTSDDKYNNDHRSDSDRDDNRDGID